MIQKSCVLKKGLSHTLFGGIIALVVFGSTACGTDLPDYFGQSELAEKIADQVQAEIDDYLICSNLDNLNVDIGSLKDLLSDPGEISPEDFLVELADVGWATQFLGGSLEGAILVSTNLNSLIQSEHVASLLTDGWNTFSCGSVIELQCISGSASSTILCNGTSASGIQLDFNQCERSSQIQTGKVMVSTIADNSSAVQIGFENFFFSENGQLDGEVTLDINTGLPFSLYLDAEKSLQIVSYGGPGDDAPSCASLLTIDSFGLNVTNEKVGLSLNGARETQKGTYGIQTIQDHLAWPTNLNCLCPNAGSGLSLEFPAPLGRSDETASAQITFAEPNYSALCASVSVTMNNWPQECSILESPASDCGRGSIERILGYAFSAMCISIDVVN
jgi:hypothetical protein